MKYIFVFFFLVCIQNIKQQKKDTGLGHWLTYNLAVTVKIVLLQFQ
jgi:hypothetical protein